MDKATHSNRGLSAPAIVATLAVLVATLFLPQVLNDGDTWWHLKLGDWIIRHLAVPHVGVFSFTHAASPWQADEWLSEVVMSTAYSIADWRGLIAVFAIAAAATVWFVARSAGRALAGAPLALLLAISVSLLAPSLLARPHLLALPALAAWTAALARARDEERAPSLYLLPLMTLWANLHGSFAFGLSLIGPFALEALLAHAARDAGFEVVRDWGLFGLGSVCAALINPYGLDGLLFPIRLILSSSLANIGEWRAQDFSRMGPLEIALLSLLGVALLRPVRVPIVRLILLLALVHLGLNQVRHQMLLGVVGPILLAKPLGLALPRAVATEAGRQRFPWATAAAFAVAALAVTIRLATPLVRTDGPYSPMAALRAVPQYVRRRPVLNDYAFGGYLIWQGVPVFIDSRSELYGDRGLAQYGELTKADRVLFDKVVARYAIGWTILSPSQPLARLLDADPAWRRVYADRFAVVHVRSPSEAPDPRDQAPLPDDASRQRPRSAAASPTRVLNRP